MNEGEQAAGLAPTPGYRYARREGARLYVAGQVPLNADGQLLAVDDPAGQATACLDNLKLLLEHHDFGIEDVCQLVVYVKGSRENLLAAWDSVVTWFPGEVPPATLLGISELGYEAQIVEVDATVVRGRSPGREDR